MVEGCSVHLSMRFSHVLQSVHISYLFGSQIHIHHIWPNFTTTFVLILIVISLNFVDWRHGWGVFCTYLWVTLFSKVYQSHRFLALKSTYIISLTTTFILMLIVIILSFVHWQHGWGVFCTFQYKIFTCSAKCTHFIPVWLSNPHTSSLNYQTLPPP